MFGLRLEDRNHLSDWNPFLVNAICYVFDSDWIGSEKWWVCRTPMFQWNWFVATFILILRALICVSLIQAEWLSFDLEMFLFWLVAICESDLLALRLCRYCPGRYPHTQCALGLDALLCDIWWWHLREMWWCKVETFRWLFRPDVMTSRILGVEYV